MLYVDGSTTNEGSGVGLIPMSPEDCTYEHALKFQLKASNNEVEYEAFGAEHLRAFSDTNWW